MRNRQRDFAALFNGCKQGFAAVDNKRYYGGIIIHLCKRYIININAYIHIGKRIYADKQRICRITLGVGFRVGGKYNRSLVPLTVRCRSTNCVTAG